MINKSNLPCIRKPVQAGMRAQVNSVEKEESMVKGTRWMLLVSCQSFCQPPASQQTSSPAYPKPRASPLARPIHCLCFQMLVESSLHRPPLSLSCPHLPLARPVSMQGRQCPKLVSAHLVLSAAKTPPPREMPPSHPYSECPLETWSKMTPSPTSI